MKNKPFLTIIVILAFLESFFIYSQPAPRAGLEFLFVVPLAFGICILWRGYEIFGYHVGGIGLKIYYFIALLRYLVQPLLIVVSQGRLNFRMPEADPSSYPVAVFIYCLEIVIAVEVIKRFYPKLIHKIKHDKEIRSQTRFTLTGIAILTIYILILVSRANVWLPALNIFGLKESSAETAIVLEATFLNCLKVFLFISLLYYARKQTPGTLDFSTGTLLAIIAAVANFIFYFGTNRSFLYETAVTTIIIYIYAFPTLKGRILMLFTPIAVLLMFYSFISKQFGESSQQSVSAIVNVNELSNIIEEYTNGLWTVARSYQASLPLTQGESIQAFWKDWVDGFQGLSDFPGFKQLSEISRDIRSSSDVFKNSLRQPDDMGQMLSLSGGFLIAGGEYFGWPLLMLGNFAMIYLLVRMEVASKFSTNLYYKYMFTWMSFLMGLVHCYCMQTIVYCWSKFILLFWLVLFLNKKRLLK